MAKQAIQFIKDHGVEKAREVVEGAPEGGTHIRDSYGFIAYLKDGERKEWYHKNTWLMTLVWQPDCLISDLKRLVESVDLVEAWGGINDIKLYDLEPCKSKPESAGYRLIQAITDYESIYGGEHV